MGGVEGCGGCEREVRGRAHTAARGAAGFARPRTTQDLPKDLGRRAVRPRAATTAGARGARREAVAGETPARAGGAGAQDLAATHVGFVLDFLFAASAHFCLLRWMLPEMHSSSERTSTMCEPAPRRKGAARARKVRRRRRGGAGGRGQRRRARQARQRRVRTAAAACARSRAQPRTEQQLLGHHRCQAAREVAAAIDLQGWRGAA